jgi:hypothetical protein
MNLQDISRLAQRQLDLEAKVAQAEQALKQAQEELRIVAEVELPEAMDAADMQEFTLGDGSKVSVTTKYVGNISEDRRGEAHDWLRTNGFASLIKHDVTVSFGKGEEQAAQEALQLLNAHGWKHQDKEGVHWQTLRAFITEQLEAGVDLPLELFGVHRLVRATIKGTS